MRCSKFDFRVCRIGRMQIFVRRDRSNIVRRGMREFQHGNVLTYFEATVVVSTAYHDKGLYWYPVCRRHL